MRIDYKRRARNLIKKTGEILPSRIATALNYEVIDDVLPALVTGCTMRILRRTYIVVDENLKDWQREAVIAHELGHLLLHRGYVAYQLGGCDFYINARLENEADAFALALMDQSFYIDDYNIDAFLKSARARGCKKC